MSISTNGGHTATWEEKAHPGELLFVITQADGIVSLATQDSVYGQAYMDARDDRAQFASDWKHVYIREEGRDVLDPVKVKIQESTDASNVTTWTLVVTNLVTYKVHKFDL